MRSKLILVAICLFSLATTAQTKVGTIDSELIIGLMPETKKVLSLIESYGKRLDSSYQIKFKDYEAKVTDFRQKQKDYPENLKSLKLQELAKAEQELQQSRSNGNKLIQIKRDEVMRPLYTKLKKVIADICKAEGYAQILTISGNEFAYIDEKFDITQKVMDKLGIKIPEQKN
ncbi:OmpH family outer membrane protein [Flavobacteriaceae bacterium S356]|uniref:OmpH family outer membrane protein n=1 Tax=Asprobacillus argus TaxID=3076534 RepID=A0ABU3LD42_9FLAO|nr:OmpH family outer membrane protein [Flavobacteriaceae bacterium S356]